MLVTSRDSESWRRPAPITSSWGWFSTIAEDRSPSATVLWLRQWLGCGRDSIFAVFGRRSGMQVLQYVILDFQAEGTHVRKITLDLEYSFWNKQNVCN